MSFAVIGYGSFGRFLAEILSQHGEVLVHTRGGNNEQAGKNISFVDFEQAAAADVVIIAVALDSFEEVCKKLAGLVKSNTIVADVCSVKIKPIEIMNKYLSGKCRILATHPLFGPHTTDVASLKGKQIVICDDTTGNHANIVMFFKYKLGLDVVKMTAEEHDREMAWVHALTFFVGRGVMKLDPPKSKLTTGYYQKLLDLVELESTHSIELFNTIERGNPFASGIREKLLATLKEIDSEINEDE